MPVYDWVIRDAELIDGTGAARRSANVGVVGDRISIVTTEDLRGEKVVDASGKILSPGFIDVHSHDDFAALFRPELACKVEQGVTSEVVGNCGIGAAPFPGAEDWLEKLHPNETAPSYEGYAGYFAALEEARPSLNIAVLAGHGALRRAGAPKSNSLLDRTELQAVERALDEALEAGVVGMSAGLIYEPGVHADAAELTRLCRRMRGAAPLFTVHLRSEANDLLPAVREAIHVAEDSGVGLQLSHHKAHGRNNWGKVVDSLALVDEARARGVDVWLDQYPYTAGSTILQAVMDRGGLSAGPALGRLLPEDIVIASAPASEELEGKSLKAIATERGISPEKAAERVLQECPGAWVVVHAMSEEDVRTVMKHPATLIGSDGLPTEGGRPHPRLHGTFPRILGRYCREEGTLSLEDAVRKMTGAAADRFRLEDRGYVREGAMADLVLFDPSEVAEGSSYENPRGAPKGIDAVWVNGEKVVDGGRHTGVRSGRALRRASV